MPRTFARGPSKMVDEFKGLQRAGLDWKEYFAKSW